MEQKIRKLAKEIAWMAGIVKAKTKASLTTWLKRTRKLTRY